MRVATNTAYSQAVTSMNRQNFDLNKTMLQLSTGKRILVPSDDPSAASRALGLNQAVSRTEQFQKNITAAESSLNVEETTLDSMVNVLQRVRELTIQGNNDTYEATQRGDIALEIKEALQSISSYANSTDGNGEYIFGGFNNRTPPFVENGSVVSYVGDQGQKLLQIGATRQIATGDNGFATFMNLSGTDDGSDPPPPAVPPPQAPMSIFAVVREIQTALENNDGVIGGVIGAEDFHDTMLRGIGNIDAAIDNITDVQAAVGSRLNAIDSQGGVNEDYLVQLKSTLSDTQDLDYAEAVSRLELEQIGLQASQQSFAKISGLSLFDFI